MSREVIDDVPDQGGPAGSTVVQFGDGTADAGDRDPHDLDPHDRDPHDRDPHDLDPGDHDSHAGSARKGGAAGPGLVGGPGERWRRTIPWAAAAGIAVLALVVGLLAGTAQGRGAQRHATLAGTQIVVWAGWWDSQPGQQRVKGALTVLSTGGAVQLGELKTDFGDFQFTPGRAVDTMATAVPFDVLADCGHFDKYTSNSDPTAVDGFRTGTALVRDRPQDPPRSVPAALSADVMVYLMLVPCSGAVVSDTIARPVVSIGNLATGSDGLTFDLALITQNPDPVRVNLRLSVHGAPFEGNLSFSAPGLPAVLRAPTGWSHIAVQLRYRCPATAFGSTLQPPSDVLQLEVAPLDPANATIQSLVVDGWDPIVVQDAVTDAMAKAGCPYPGTPASRGTTSAGANRPSAGGSSASASAHRPSASGSSASASAP